MAKELFQVTLKWVQRWFLWERKGEVTACRWTEVTGVERGCCSPDDGGDGYWLDAGSTGLAAGF